MPSVNLPLPFEAYQGKDPYIFISYAHADAEIVYPDIKYFHELGYRIWYDEGIDPGSEWPVEIANAISSCSYFIVFITPNSVQSRNVRNEINLAISLNKDCLAIHLDETQLPTGLNLQMGSLQAVLKYNHTADSYDRKIKKALSPNLLFDNKKLISAPPVMAEISPAQEHPLTPDQHPELQGSQNLNPSSSLHGKSARFPAWGFILGGVIFLGLVVAILSSNGLLAGKPANNSTPIPAQAEISTSGESTSPAADPSAASAALNPPLSPADITIVYSGYSQGGAAPLYDSVVAEAKAMGVNLVDFSIDGQEDPYAQVADVERAISLKPSVIAIQTLNPDIWAETIAKAEAANIPVICFDQPISNPYISTSILADNVTSSGLGGEYICNATGGKGSALVIGGEIGSIIGDRRKQGAEEKLRDCGMNVIGAWDNWDSNKAVDIAQNTLKDHADLAGIFVVNDDAAAAVAEMIKQKGLTNQIMVVGFDGHPVMLNAIKAGYAAATVKQDLVMMGKVLVDEAVAIANGESVNSEILLPGFVIDKTNVDQYLTE